MKLLLRSACSFKCVAVGSPCRRNPVAISFASASNNALQVQLLILFTSDRNPILPQTALQNLNYVLVKVSLAVFSHVSLKCHMRKGTVHILSLQNVPEQSLAS